MNLFSSARHKGRFVSALIAIGVLGDGSAAWAAPDFGTGPIKGGAVTGEPLGVPFIGISAGTNHTLAIGEDGNTYAWGNNANGRLGNGGTTGR
ncbi:hypothetical protein [Lysinibacter sp. HNR]|uniref:hypothetical protein n=1 Tax=Lysinibacter sp. HNR TaxID=3031408 RepID=UPI0024359840|nr:hypothetical protein [Lysinibacter sp. HNR]WGD37525.1 hypothetical protein FrondiHNR_00960 [Lysinibacter sp. HNR]